MEAMNRAIEDASDYTEFQRKLLQKRHDWAVAALPERVMAEPPRSPRRPGENREQHRARLRAEQKA